MRHHNLEKFAGGALSAQVNKALKKVTENIIDPNTDPTKERRITVTIKMKANELRNFVATGIETKLTLAPELGAATALSMGQDLESGEVDCVEVGSQIPGQLVMDLKNTEEPEWFDPDTGEVFDQESVMDSGSNVIDLRKVAR